jgi:hypothetical protein
MAISDPITQDVRYIRWAQRTLGLPAGDSAEDGEADAGGSSGGDGSQDCGQSASCSGGEDEGSHADAGADAMRRCITERLRSEAITSSTTPPVWQLTLPLRICYTGIVSRPGNQGL